MNYRFLKPAQRELRKAVAYYDEQRPGLGDAFLDEIENAIKRVLQFPEAHLLVANEIRRIRTKRFPYSLLYRVYQSEVVVVAIMHGKQRPDSWKDQLGADEIW